MISYIKNMPLFQFLKNKKLFCALLIAAPCLLAAKSVVAVVDSAAIVAYLMPLNSFIFGLMTSMFKFAIYLSMSASLLQTTILNPGWIDIESDFVQTGLTVTMSLADICLIVVFIVIALAYVFKIESFHPEKTLPKFFIIALLIHFSPLFVKMLVDVSNIATPSLIVGQQTIILDSCKEFAHGLIQSGALLMMEYSVNSLAAAVPLGSLANAVRIIAIVLGNSYWLTTIPYYLVQVLVGEILSGLMFSYAIFFITRVFMIQILAVLAPLAILASVLPQTNRMFSDWFKWLIGWSIAGPMTLFLLTLGLSTLKSLLPDISTGYVSLGGTYNIFLRQDTLYWFMICIYMMTADAIVAGTIPQISGKITDKLTGSLKPIANIGRKMTKEAKGRLDSGIKSRAKASPEAFSNFRTRPSSSSAQASSAQPSSAPTQSSSSSSVNMPSGFGPPSMPDI